MKKENITRCDICGRFVGLNDFLDNKLVAEYTPDSHFSSECLTYMHRECYEREVVRWKRNDNGRAT